MAKKYGTYLIEYSDGTSSIHGNNYKPWYQHAVEYIYSRFKNPENGWCYSDVADKIVAVKFSESPFIDDGGLKWATPEGYQEIIDEVAAKNHMQYTPYADIHFENSSVDKSKLIKKLKEY